MALTTRINANDVAFLLIDHQSGLGVMLLHSLRSRQSKTSL